MPTTAPKLDRDNSPPDKLIGGGIKPPNGDRPEITKHGCGPYILILAVILFMTVVILNAMGRAGIRL